MDKIVKILAPFAASENGEYNSLMKKLYCVWKLPTGIYVANHYIVIKVKNPCEIVQCVNVNLKCYEKFSTVPLKSIEVDHNFNADKDILVNDDHKQYFKAIFNDFFADNDILVNDGHKQYFKAIFNNPPDMDGLLQENKKADITSNIFVNVINTLKSISKECEYIVINNTVFNSYLFTNLLKVFKEMCDKEINIVFRGEKHFSVQFISEKIDAILMPLYHLDILNDMEKKYKEDNNIVTYL